MIAIFTDEDGPVGVNAATVANFYSVSEGSRVRTRIVFCACDADGAPMRYDVNESFGFVRDSLREALK